MSRIHLLIIEEHSAVRRALEVRLSSSKRIELLAAVNDLNSGGQYVGVLRPDVVLLGCKGGRNEKLIPLIEVVSEIVQQGTAVIVLTAYADEIEREMLLQAGAKRYLLKDINTPQLIAEIEAVARQNIPNGSHYKGDYSVVAQLATNDCLVKLDNP